MLYDKKWDREIESTTIESWQKVLLDAADLIEHGGWIRHHYQQDGRYCMMGAINEVIDLNKKGYCSDEVAWNKAVHSLVIRIGSITRWNDNVAKNQDEVIHMLRKVAKEG